MLGHNSRRLPKADKMYAIVFDIDTNQLKQLYPKPSWQNAYGDIRAYLADNGFENQQGSTCFGNDEVTAV